MNNEEYAKYRLAGDVGWSLHSAMVYTIIRNFGHEAAENLEGKMMAEHQAQYFLPGLRKLGLDKETSDAVRCAKYHYFSNILGGLHLSYAEESPDKAWVFYNTPHYIDSPMTPSIGIALMRPGFLTKQMYAWHGNNGKLLGNPGLAFVVTHLVMRGDPWDGGYFIDTHRQLGPWETLQFNWGEEPPEDVPIQRPQLDSKEWPPERQAKAIRNDVVGYVGSKTFFLNREFGPEAAAAIVEHALRVTLFQRMDQLQREFGLAEPWTPRSAASLLARFQELFGAETRIEESSDGTVTVEQLNSRIHQVPEFTEHSEMPRVVEEGFERAWAAVCRHLNRDLALVTTASFARGDDRWTWVLTQA